MSAMANRSDEIDDFLARSGWRGARRVALAGDASFRRYERVFLNGKQAVLMDAPPQKEDVRPFLHVGEHLFASGLSAPDVYARDTVRGLLLLEDLGDALYARVLREEPHRETELYEAAVDVLAALGKQAHAPSLAIPRYDMPRYLQQVALLPEWFLPLLGDPSPKLEERYLDLWKDALARLPFLEDVPVLYDFHAENLLWLPDRPGLKRAGLLDFQDAVWGSPAYDLVSLLEDARRDVSPKTVEAMIDRYLAATGLAREDFLTAYAILGAQRNARIVGTFVRLAVRDGKQHYLAFMPRVWRHLERDLNHPFLAPLKAWIDEHVPAQWRGLIEPERLKRRAEA